MLHLLTTGKGIANILVCKAALGFALGKERLNKQINFFTTACAIIGKPAMHFCRPLLMVGNP